MTAAHEQRIASQAAAWERVHAALWDMGLGGFDAAGSGVDRAVAFLRHVRDDRTTLGKRVQELEAQADGIEAMDDAERARLLATAEMQNGTIQRQRDRLQTQRVAIVALQRINRDLRNDVVEVLQALKPLLPGLVSMAGGDTDGGPSKQREDLPGQKYLMDPLAVIDDEVA